MPGLSFEKAIQKLEKIVEKLESSNIDIDGSLKVFEEGVKLSRFCSKKLDEAEKKIELLLKNEKGEFRTELFPGSMEKED